MLRLLLGEGVICPCGARHPKQSKSKPLASRWSANKTDIRSRSVPASPHGSALARLGSLLLRCLLSCVALSRKRSSFDDMLSRLFPVPLFCCGLGGAIFPSGPKHCFVFVTQLKPASLSLRLSKHHANTMLRPARPFASHSCASK